MGYEQIQYDEEPEQEVEREPKPDPDHRFEIKVDNATYAIGIFFKKDARLSLEDRVKRLIRQDALAGNC